MGTMNMVEMSLEMFLDFVKQQIMIGNYKQGLLGLGKPGVG